jgi:hypothetical protein
MLPPPLFPALLPPPPEHDENINITAVIAINLFIVKSPPINRANLQYLNDIYKAFIVAADPR